MSAAPGVLLAALAATALAAAPAPQGGAARSHLLVVAGIGGEPQYGQAFHEAASAVVTAARERYGVPDSNVVYLGEDPARDPARIAGKSTKANVEQALAAMARRAGAGDQVWVVLIGHGSSQGEESRFNLPGPDMSAADFKRLLARFPTQRVAFVNAASASGDFARELAGRNRVVVTATKSGLERNETVFARYFAAALAGDGADADKNGRVSLLEAFTYAKREVARHYEQGNRLLTEHAQLADGGSLAASLVLAGGRAGAPGAASDPRVAALAAERSAIEAKVEALKGRRASMDAATYERELEALLVELALKSREIRAAERTPR